MPATPTLARLVLARVALVLGFTLFLLVWGCSMRAATAADLPRSSASGPVDIGFLGDSIDRGLAAAFGVRGGTPREIHTTRAQAKVGASGNTIVTWPTPQTRYLVVSMGSNPTVALTKQLARAQRQARSGATLILILPAKGQARRDVADFARDRRLRAVPFAPGRDGIHPRSYAVLAARVRRLIPR